MHYHASRNVGRSMFSRERTMSLPVVNVPITWHGPSALDEENFPNTMLDLHEIGFYQQPCNPLLVSLVHQGLSQCHSLPNLTSPSSTLAESTNMHLQSCIHCINPQAPSSPALEEYPHSGNMLALPQLHLSKAQGSSMQTSTSTSQQGLELTYQPNEDAQLPGDIGDMLPSAVEQEELMESDQPNQIILSNGNPDGCKIMNQEAQVSCINVGNKSRMQWTQELHESFVQAVNDLGGADKATPKCILVKMGVPGLTIYHVKSHLQKYRLERYRPEGKEDHDVSDKRPSCSKGKRQNAAEDSGAPKLSSKELETLHMQWELQKKLHEQLKSIRKLQLQTEELQKFMEDQYKVREAFIQATQSMSMTKGVATEGTLAPFTSDKLLVSLDDKYSMKDETLSNLAKSDVSTSIELDSPSYKRARIDA